MSETIGVNELKATVDRILEEYGDECTEIMKEVVPKVSKRNARKLKGVHSGAFKNRSGAYRKGWKTKIIEKRLGVEGIIYNTKAGLTHLLEFGHAVVRGGRRVGDAKAYSHIAGVNTEAQEEFEKELMEKL